MSCIDRYLVRAPTDSDRTVAAVFFSGGVSTITFNTVVQLPVSEMVGDPPCANGFFEALSPDKFAHLISSATYGTGQGLSLKGCVALYLQDHWPQYEHPMFSSLNSRLLTTRIVGAYPLFLPSSNLRVLSTRLEARQIVLITSTWDSSP